MKCDYLRKEDIKRIKNNMNDLDSLLYVVDCITAEMCNEAYYDGYMVGYDEGYDQRYLDAENE